jgi:uncharacterized protein (DUF779 family)
MGHEQFEYWRHAQLIVDVAHGMDEIGALDSGIGNRFVTHARLFSEDEKQQLNQAPSTAPSR